MCTKLNLAESACRTSKEEVNKDEEPEDVYNMEMARIWIVYLLVAITLTETAKLKRQEKQACGTVLTQLIAVVCDSKYNPERLSKRSVDENKLSRVLLPRESARSLLRSRRMRRGVYDECCRKPCAIEEIRNYCLNR